MIIVELVVPFLSRSYEIELDETTEVGQAVEELAEVICAKERWSQLPSGKRLELFDLGAKRRVSRAQTLEEASIKTGARLMLC